MASFMQHLFRHFRQFPLFHGKFRPRKIERDRLGFGLCSCTSAERYSRVVEVWIDTADSTIDLRSAPKERSKKKTDEKRSLASGDGSLDRYHRRRNRPGKWA